MRCARASAALSGDQDPEETGEEVAQDVERSEGNADADRRQEAGEGSGCEKAGGQASTQVGLKRPVIGPGCVSIAPPTCCAAGRQCSELTSAFGVTADMVGSRWAAPVANPSGRWMFGHVFGLDGQESYRELRLELLYCLTV
jgi:hypothetical protein